MSLKKSFFAPSEFPHLPEVSGLSLSTIATGIRYKNRNDLLCVRFDKPATTAAVFTKSSMPSAPVDFCRESLANGFKTSVLVVNAGNANAFTGRAGKECCDTVAHLVSEKAQCRPEEIFQASTGVIGKKLDGRILAEWANKNIEKATWQSAAQTIMTTDTFPKASGQTISFGDKKINLVGIAKGSGMIAPNMGTMLAFIFTDAEINQKTLQEIVAQVTDISFNVITVDGDTSTSDTLGVFATGASGFVIENKADIQIFKNALKQLSTDLAMQIVKDGEGLTKFITINVNDAISDESARKIGLSIANSPLVKTAIAGQDANWGRIVAAIGKSGELANRDKTSVSMGGITIAEMGEAVEGYDETPVAHHMKQPEILIDVSVGVGNGKATIYTTDLTKDYIDINADYRS